MAAFGELFDRYYDVVFRYVLFRMGDRALAEDVTQETFVARSAPDLVGQLPGPRHRRVVRHDRPQPDLRPREVQPVPAGADHRRDRRAVARARSGPEQQVLDGATNEELLRCVRKLNPDQQECIPLRFLQGLSVAETAEIMDRNEGAVKALQHRAVRRLAQLLPEGLR